MQFYSLIELENSILKIFNQPINPTFNNFMVFLNYSIYVYLTILLIYYYKKRVGIFFWRRRVKKFIQLVFNSAMGIVFIYILKYSIGRPRPPMEQFSPIIQKLDPSFPSSHAFMSFLCLVFLPKELSVWLKLISVIYLVVAIPVSAMYMGVHYPSDIICGAFIGLIFPYIFSERISERIIGKLFKIVRKIRKLCKFL